jgi:hypothetical protein
MTVSPRVIEYNTSKVFLRGDPLLDPTLLKVRKEASGGRLERYVSGPKKLLIQVRVLLHHTSYSYEYFFVFLIGLVPSSGEGTVRGCVYKGLRWLRPIYNLLQRDSVSYVCLV